MELFFLWRNLRRHWMPETCACFSEGLWMSTWHLNLKMETLASSALLRSCWAWYLLHTAVIWVHLCYHVSQDSSCSSHKPSLKAYLNQQRNYSRNCEVQRKWSCWDTAGNRASVSLFLHLFLCMGLSVFLSPSLAYAFPHVTFISQKQTFIVGAKKSPATPALHFTFGTS